MGNFDKIYEFENIFVNQNYVLPVGKVRQVSELSIIPNGEIIEHKFYPMTIYTVYQAAKFILLKMASSIKL